MSDILDRMSDIAIIEVEHGPAQGRRYGGEPTWQMRGLAERYLTFTAVA